MIDAKPAGGGRRGVAQRMDYSIRFRRLPVTLDPHPLLAQLAKQPDLWNSSDEWTRNKPLLYATNNIVLRYNKAPPGSPIPGIGWNRPAFALLPAAVEMIFDVMRAIPAEHLGKVMISRLAPGEKINWHIDTWPLPGRPYFERYQIPLQGSAGVRFCVEHEDLYMQPGTAWWFDNQRMHAVFNDSDEDRISMFADIRPFALSA